MYSRGESSTKKSMLFNSSSRKSSSWPEMISQLLQPVPTYKAGMRVLDLFAGCGGLALGFEAAGFETIGFEMAAQAANTYETNLAGKCFNVCLELGYPYPEADVIIGGPPCQPFSVIGEQRGKRDSRDGFPIFLDAVERVKPAFALIENVKGIMYRNKLYFHSVVKSLEKLGYEVDARVLNAKNFGVPQNRERLFIAASKVGWSWPAITTPVPVTVGEALGDLIEALPAKPKWLNEKHDAYIATYEKKSQCRPRDLDPSKPSRTVTCRNLYAMTGDMLRLKRQDGRRRMLEVLEAARLQSFPDWFAFQGAETRKLEMIGNAVPPLLGLALAEQVKAHLRKEQVSSDMLRLVKA